MILLPTVTDDFDGQCRALDEAILLAAQDFKFSYAMASEEYRGTTRVPDLVYKLISHYTHRGFLCRYAAETGELKINWDHPNMSWMEHTSITRSIPAMLPSLGINFRAGLVYLCMTNGVDLRDQNDITIQRQLKKAINQAATLGNEEVCFGFPEVPAPVVAELFKATFDTLLSQGFIITYNINTNLYTIKWGDTLLLTFRAGETMTGELS